MARRLSLSLALLAAASLAAGTAQAESQRPPQPLAVLLKQLNAKPLGLSDGMRLLWRVPSSQTRAGRSTFYGNSSFLSATGIERSWVCTAPSRVLE